MKFVRTLLIFVILLVSYTGFSQEIKKIKITELQKTITESKTPLIINFWATYCGPCIEEIPYFQELVKKYEDKDVKLLLVSLDFEDFYPEKIRKFADKMKFTAPIAWLDETNADYFCPKIDTAWSGVMPATLLVNNTRKFRAFFEEKIPRQKFEEEIQKMLKYQ